MAEKFDGRMVTEYGTVPLNELQEMMWSKINPKDYDDPPKDWIPNDDKLRFEWLQVLNQGE